MSFLSSFSLVFGAVPKLVDMLYSWFKKKTDKKQQMLDELTRLEVSLSSALRDGRMTDAAKLSKERNELLENLYKLT